MALTTQPNKLEARPPLEVRDKLRIPYSYEFQWTLYALCRGVPPAPTTREFPNEKEKRGSA